MLKKDLQLGVGRRTAHDLIRHIGGRISHLVLDAALCALHHGHGRHLRDSGERGVGLEDETESRRESGE